MAAWSTVDFEKNMQSRSSSMMAVSLPSSRSGSGGGGFSGGGFGGGEGIVVVYGAYAGTHH